MAREYRQHSDKNAVLREHIHGCAYLQSWNLVLDSRTAGVGEIRK